MLQRTALVTATTKLVSLPDGDTVEISLVPIPDWTTKNASFYVDPRIIAPDPKNSRRVMSPLRLAELNESIKERGVRQQLVVTPRALVPWVELPPESENCFFVAVSGHRRRMGALTGNIGAVPVKVSIYPSEKEHRLDLALLNTGQDELTPLEKGYEISDLQKLGWKIEELSKFFGLAVPQLYNRMNLTKLHPDIQNLLDEELPREQRVPITMGGMLGGVKTPEAEELEELFESFKEVVQQTEITDLKNLDTVEQEELRFILQKLLLAVIKKRGLGTERAVEFIRDRTLQFKSNGSNGRPTERFQPQRRKDIILNLLKEVEGSVIIDWDFKELARIFEFSSYEDVDEYVKHIKRAAEVFTGIGESLEKIRDHKKPTHPDALRILARAKSTVES